MSTKAGSYDHRDNEFYASRYTTWLKKGDIVEIRSGIDLEVARFQAKKNFPDVLNEYWWLKPSDVAALKEIPLQVNDIYYYHGGIPVALMLTAQGALARKAQIFIRARNAPKNSLQPEQDQAIESLTCEYLMPLLDDPNLLIRRKALATLQKNYPDAKPTNTETLINYLILIGGYEELVGLGGVSADALIERFFVTSNAKEAERILDALINIGKPAIGPLEEIVEYLSEMASPFYAKRIQWTIRQIKSRRKVS